MVGLFVRLKLRLLRNGLRTPTRAVFLVLGLVFGVLAGGLVGVALLVLRDDPPVAAAAGMLVAALLAVGWATLPIAAFGVDETLDVSRLAVLPLPRRRLVAGLLAASAIGVPPLLSALLLTAAVVAVTTSAAAVPVAAVALVLLLAMCLLLGRFTTSALSGFLRSRRGRDLAVLVGVLVVLAAQLPRLLVENVGEDGLVRIGAVLRWTPPGAAVRAVADASAGSWGPAVLELAYAAAVVGLLLAGWYATLGAALVVVDASTSPGRRRRRGLPALLPDGRLGAVAGKELRYAWRDPRLKFTWLQMMAIGVAMPAFTLLDEGRFAPLTAAAFTTLLAGSLGYNLFGPEGSAFWLTVVGTGDERDARTDLAGRNLSTALVTMSWVLVAAVALAFVAVPVGSVPAAVAAAVGAGAAVLGAGLGVAVVASVLAAYPVQEQAGAVFAGPGAGRGCVAGLVWMVGSAVTAVAALPVVLPAYLWGAWPVALAVLVGGPLWGAGVAFVGRRIAAALLVDRLPEMLVTVTPDRT